MRLTQIWQQRLAASGVATFAWQNDESPPPAVLPSDTGPTPSDTRRLPPETKFHNPALAAIRASQQLQELAAQGDVNGADDGVQASIQALQQLAAEQDRKFHAQHLSETNGSETSTPENPWPSSSNVEPGSHKRRISEVSDVEAQPVRPPPLIDESVYEYSSTASNPILNNSRAPPSPPPRRKPDPNDDTIGSDLDDSEDEADMASDEEDENMPLMLCSYEKVHRTKNKWRANLSNGVVCIGGREWVFERGTGEYEW